MSDAPLVAVVNGDNGNLTLLQALLTERGYRVMLHKDGTAAHSTLKRSRPDLVLLDVPIDDPAGSWTLLDLLTLDPDTLGIPVLVCCNEPKMVAHKVDILRQAGNDILEKPFSKDILIGRVEALLHT